MRFYRRLKPFCMISFDLDDTLWNNWPVIQHAEHCLSQFIEQHYPAVSARYTKQQINQLRDQLVAEQPSRLCDLSQLRRLTLTTIFKRCRYSNEDAEQAFQVFYNARQQITPYQQAKPMLEALTQKYPLIALSNGNSSLQATGLSQYFQHDIRAADLACRKPDTAFYTNAAKLAKQPARNILHIGDHFAFDAVAAQQAGYQSIWFNPFRHRPQATTQHYQLPTAELFQLADLTKYLKI